MSERVIRSRDNPLIKDMAGLARSRQHRRRSGQALIEGPHLVQAFMQARVGPADVVAVAEGALNRPEIRKSFEAVPATDRVIVPDALLSSVCDVVTSQGLLAVITVPRFEDAARDQEAVMLDRIQDPGNLGTILRTTRAAGLRNVLISTRSVDAWSPKVLRAGMGAHFGLRIREQADLLAMVTRSSFPVYAAQAGAAQSLYGLDLAGASSWIFGNEGAGIAPQLSQHARPVAIPMPGGAESLNVAAAVAVCLFEQVRQRQRPIVEV